MRYNSKIYWQYLFTQHLNPMSQIRTLTFYRDLLIILLFIIVYFSKLSIKLKATLTILIFIIMIILELYSVYKSGVHIAWDRKRRGMVTKSWLHKMKEQRKLQKKELTNKEEQEYEKIESEAIGEGMKNVKRE